MTVLVLVTPYGLSSTMRFVEAATTIEGLTIGVISHESASDFAGKLGETARRRIEGFVTIDDAFNPDQLEYGVRQVATELGGRVDKLASILEPLQVPVAVVRERLGIEGMDASEAARFRDKALMKTTLREAGLPCAHHCLATSAKQAMDFAHKQLPLVVKPPAGAGAADTFRVDSANHMAEWLATHQPTPESPIMLEEFIQGEEFSFDSVMVDGEMVFHSISQYSPTPLEVMSTPWIQWTVLMPHDIDIPEFAAITEVGPQALKALGMRTGMSHMEWFRRSDGTIAISEVGARPPGAQITTLLSYVHDHDFYRAWAQLSGFGTFDVPKRSYAAGAAYLRGQGVGAVSGLEGVDKLQRELGHLVVEAQLPYTGQAKASGYEGEGYVIVRDRETPVVAEALERIVSQLRVHLSEQP